MCSKGNKGRKVGAYGQIISLGTTVNTAVVVEDEIIVI